MDEKALKTDFLDDLKKLFRSKGKSKKKERAFVDLFNGSLNAIVGRAEKRALINKEMVLKALLPESRDSYLVFVNGFFEESLSSYPSTIQVSKGLFCSSEEENEMEMFKMDRKKNPQEEILIKIERETSLNEPLQILQVISEDLLQNSFLIPKIKLELGENSFASFYFSSFSLTKNLYLLNQNLKIDLKERSALDLYFYNSGSSFFNFTKAGLAKESRLTVSYLTRADLDYGNFKVDLRGEGSKFFLYSLQLLEEQKEAHLEIKVDHLAKDTISKEFVKTLLKERALFNFKALVTLSKNAEKAEAEELNNNLLLSPKAIAFSEPILKVFANDVKAHHGATFSFLDEEELFYLLSRGLKKKEAVRLLIKVFCQEIINQINNKTVQEEVKTRVEEFLEKR